MKKQFIKTFIGFKLLVCSDLMSDGVYDHIIHLTFHCKNILYIKWSTGVIGEVVITKAPIHEVTPFQVKWFRQSRALADGVVEL
jgi:hypothetical protein